MNLGLKIGIQMLTRVKFCKKLLQGLLGLAFAITLLLPGCTLFQAVKVPNIQTYTLGKSTASAVKTHHNTRNIGVLKVSEPVANPINSTARMIYTTKPYQIGYFSLNRWADLPTRLLQPLMMTSLEKSHQFTVVDAAFSGDYTFRLDSRLIELKQVFSGSSSELRFSIAAQLIRMHDRKVIATHIFTFCRPAQPNPYGGVRAANQAVTRFLKALVQWVSCHCSDGVKHPIN